MAWYNTLGNKIVGEAHYLGQKALNNVKRGATWVGSHAKAVGDVASVVGDVAGVAATGAAMIGLEPIAAGLGAVAAGAKGVSKVAGYLDSSYQAGRYAGKTIDHLRHGRRGQAIGSAATAAAAAKLATARRKNIERAVRAGRK
tara:strand:+ start:4754 stop:5182 length:429 start_codon:yes stop_codon:yes gene_type:complete